MNQDKAKILYYTDTFCNLSETWVYRLACSIKNFDVHVLTHSFKNAESFPSASFNSTLYPLTIHSKIGRAVSFAFNTFQFGLRSSSILSPSKLSKSAKGEQFNVCLAHFASCGIQILPYCLKNGIPLVTYLHGCDLGSWLNHKWYPGNLRRLFAAGDLFLVPTNYMRNKAIRKGCPPEKCRVCPVAAIVPNQIRPRQERSHNHPIHFLFVGRLHPQKGVIETLLAFDRFYRKLPNAKLVLIGDGPLRKQVESKLIQLKLENAVELLGALPYDRVAEAYRRADVFVIHSKTTDDGDEESFGVVLAEAAAHGLPVVATRHNGFPEVVPEGKGSILVEEGDWQAMAEAMQTLASNPEHRKQLGEKGRQHVLENFTTEQSAGSVESILAELLRG